MRLTDSESVRTPCAGVEAGVEGIGNPLGDGQIEPLLGVKVVGDGSDVLPRGQRDIAGGGPLQSPLRKQGQPGIDQGLTRLFAAGVVLAITELMQGVVIATSLKVNHMID